MIGEDGASVEFGSMRRSTDQVKDDFIGASFRTPERYLFIKITYRASESDVTSEQEQFRADGTWKAPSAFPMEAF